MAEKIEVVGFGLTALTFKEITLSDDKVKPSISFKIKDEIKEIETEFFTTIWTLLFCFETAFEIEAKFEMLCKKDKKVTEKQIKSQIAESAYPVLSEFSLLIATMTRSMGAVPFVIDVQELRERGGLAVEEESPVDQENN